MTETAQVRVARGAAWLDKKYPGWHQGIDLSILDISSCHLCVLGQVYTGCIPAEERGQLVAQVARLHVDMRPDTRRLVDWTASIATWGGYSVLEIFHDLPGSGMPYGFVGGRDEDGCDLADSATLTDEWTRVIIGRRLAEHLDAQAPAGREPAMAA